ncbi:MAG TPA: hypothetical protein VL330_21185 [Actinomycetes bacterium]|nr:hypothetical protein [Actinomycetes bacterium]
MVSGVPRLLPPSAAAAAVVGVGQGRPSHSGGAPGPPNAWNASTTTIPAVATPVATHGRLPSHRINPVSAAAPPARDPAGPGPVAGPPDPELPEVRAAASATSGC